MKNKPKSYLLVVDNPIMGRDDDYYFVTENGLKECNTFHEFTTVYEIAKELTDREKEALGMTSLKKGRK